MIVTFYKLLLSMCCFLLTKSQQNMYSFNEPNTDFSGACATGTEQSPIDFPANFTSYLQDPKVKIVSSAYGQAGNGLLNGTLSIVNNRYIITGTAMGYIEITKNGNTYRYTLTDISFHIPSEHKFLGYNGAMEMQLNHKKDLDWLKIAGLADLDSRNSQLIISVIFKIGIYNDNPNIARINFNTSTTNNFNLAVFPPIGKPFIFYEGSLTLPTCGEFVNWVVVHKMELISQAQFNLFKNWIRMTKDALGAITEQNARSVKPINNRQLYYQIYPNQEIVLSSGFLRASSIFVTIILFLF